MTWALEMKSRPVRSVPAPASPQIPHNLHHQDLLQTAVPPVPWSKEAALQWPCLHPGNTVTHYEPKEGKVWFIINNCIWILQVFTNKTSLHWDGHTRFLRTHAYTQKNFTSYHSSGLEIGMWIYLLKRRSSEQRIKTTQTDFWRSNMEDLPILTVSHN